MSRQYILGLLEIAHPMKIDPLSSQVLQLLKQTPAKVLVIGGFAIAPELLGRDEARAVPWLDAAPDDGEVFDSVLYRAEPETPGESLGRLRQLLAPRGRLIVVVPAAERHQLLLDLLGFGFVFLEEHEVNLVTSKVRVLALRREDFPVRALGPGDEKDVLELFTPSFHVQRSQEHWRWKYDDNPWGKRNITVAFSPEGELVAHYAGYPVPMVLTTYGRQTELLGLQIGDTMTDPRYRQVGRGPTSLLGRCVRHYYTAFCEDRVAFNFGWNTGNIQKFSMLFVGAHRIEPVGYWQRPAERPLKTYGYRTRRVSQLTTAFDRLFARVSPHYGLLVRRDSAYLKWRYQDCPDAPPFVILAAWSFFRLVGFAVFRRRGDHLVWADALFDPRHLRASADLLAQALALPEFQGVSAVEAWFPPRPSWFWHYLSELGFSARPEPNDLALMLVPHLEKRAPQLLREKYYYTLGDSDLI